MGAGGVIIIRNGLKSLATMELVTQNLTAAEASQRDAITNKPVGDWTLRDFRKLQTFVAIAAGRCE